MGTTGESTTIVETTTVSPVGTTTTGESTKSVLATTSSPETTTVSPTTPMATTVPDFTTPDQPIIVTTAETVTVTESATPVKTTPSFSMTTTPKEDSTTPEMCPCVDQPSCPPAGNRILIDSLPNLQIVLPEAYLESLNREALDLDSDSVVYIRPSQIVIGKA